MTVPSDWFVVPSVREVTYFRQTDVYEEVTENGYTQQRRTGKKRAYHDTFVNRPVNLRWIFTVEKDGYTGGYDFKTDETCKVEMPNIVFEGNGGGPMAHWVFPTVEERDDAYERILAKFY
jgi:hypothetical protein